MPLRLGFDMDGVVADFRTAFETAAHGAAHLPVGADPEETEGEPLSTREIKRVWAAVKRTSNWWTKLAAYEPAQIARLYAITRQLKWEVVFMTRRPETAGSAVSDTVVPRARIYLRPSPHGSAATCERSGST
jgi:hypothetical protein